MKKIITLLVLAASITSCTTGQRDAARKKAVVRDTWQSQVSHNWYDEPGTHCVYLDTMYVVGDTVQTSQKGAYWIVVKD